MDGEWRGWRQRGNRDDFRYGSVYSARISADGEWDHDRSGGDFGLHKDSEQCDYAGKSGTTNHRGHADFHSGGNVQLDGEWGALREWRDDLFWKHGADDDADFFDAAYSIGHGDGRASGKHFDYGEKP